MCDFFWLSPTDQGDLSDVVRASLQPRPSPHHRLPTPPVCGHGSLGAHDVPEEEDEPLLQQQGVNSCGDDEDDQVNLQQLVHGDGVGSSNGASSCGPLSSPASYPLQPEGLERKGDAAAPPEVDQHGMDMAMAPHPHAPPIKRRKSQTKKVVCIPATTVAPPGASGRGSTSGEVVPSDLWAWRKYGQKPIKGSPYPRGYYRCSSSKGCSARKQVERSRTNPSMLVITYTFDHNHPWPTQRNALAGSVRQHHSSSSAKSRHRCSSSTPVVAPSPPSSLKQELDHHPTPEQNAASADHEPDMLDGAISIHPAPSINSKKQQLLSEKLPDECDKQQLLDPFSFSLFDWVGASFGIGDANK